MPNVATADTVSREELLDFLRPRHNGIYVARRGDGRPQLSPVSCGIDPEGRIVVSTYPQRAKTRNTRRDPEVSICVLSADFGGAVDLHPGPAEVVGEDADVHFGVAAGIPRLRPLRVRRHHDAALGINAAAHRGELRPPVPAPGHVDPVVPGTQEVEELFAGDHVGGGDVGHARDVSALCQQTRVAERHSSSPNQHCAQASSAASTTSSQISWVRRASRAETIRPACTASRNAAHMAVNPRWVDTEVQSPRRTRRTPSGSPASCRQTSARSTTRCLCPSPSTSRTSSLEPLTRCITPRPATSPTCKPRVTVRRSPSATEQWMSTCSTPCGIRKRSVSTT